MLSHDKEKLTKLLKLCEIMKKKSFTGKRPSTSVATDATDIFLKGVPFFPSHSSPVHGRDRSLFIA